MKIKDYIIIGLVAVAIYLFWRSPEPHIIEKPPVYKIDSITIVKTQTDTVYIPKWSTKTMIKTDSFLDTVFVYIDYNTKYIYLDTILNDYRGIVTVLDTIYRNKIASRKTDISINARNIYHTIVKKEKKRYKFAIGGGVNGWSNKFGFKLGGAMINKNDGVFIMNYDIINKSMQVGYYHKISLKQNGQ